MDRNKIVDIEVRGVPVEALRLEESQELLEEVLSGERWTLLYPLAEALANSFVEESDYSIAQLEREGYQALEDWRLPEYLMLTSSDKEKRLSVEVLSYGVLEENSLGQEWLEDVCNIEHFPPAKGGETAPRRFFAISLGEVVTSRGITQRSAEPPFSPYPLDSLALGGLKYHLITLQASRAEVRDFIEKRADLKITYLTDVLARDLASYQLDWLQPFGGKKWACRLRGFTEGWEATFSCHCVLIPLNAEGAAYAREELGLDLQDEGYPIEYTSNDEVSYAVLAVRLGKLLSKEGL